MTLVRVEFEDSALMVEPNVEHGWVLPSEQVAAGFEVDSSTIRQQLYRNPTEYREGLHFFARVTAGHAGPPKREIMWTQKGVIRLGFALRSDRAKRFRDFAETLVVAAMQPPVAALPAPQGMPIEVMQAISTFMAAATQAQMDLQNRMAVIEQAIHDQPINSVQVGQIHRLGQEWGRLRGSYGGAWHDFKQAFGLASYRDLPQSRYSEAVGFLNTQIATLQTTGLFVEGAEA